MVFSLEIDSGMTFLCLRHPECLGRALSTFDLFIPRLRTSVTSDNSIKIDSDCPPVYSGQQREVNISLTIWIGLIGFICWIENEQ